MKRFFALAIAMIVLCIPTPAHVRAFSACVSETTTYIEGGCVVERKETCCQFPDGSLSCTVIIQAVYCP